MKHGSVGQLTAELVVDSASESFHLLAAGFARIGRFKLRDVSGGPGRMIPQGLAALYRRCLEYVEDSRRADHSHRERPGHSNGAHNVPERSLEGAGCRAGYTAPNGAHYGRSFAHALVVTFRRAWTGRGVRNR